MADDEDKAKAVEKAQQETANSEQEEKTEVAAKDEVEEENGSKMEVSHSTFISTTESMKNAARTKVDTIISQVRLALQSQDDSKENKKSKGEKESGTSTLEDGTELKFVDALCDSVSLKGVVNLIRKIPNSNLKSKYYRGSYRSVVFTMANI